MASVDMLPQITSGSQTWAFVLMRKQLDCWNLYSTFGGLAERRVRENTSWWIRGHLLAGSQGFPSSLSERMTVRSCVGCGGVESGVGVGALTLRSSFEGTTNSRNGSNIRQ